MSPADRGASSRLAAVLGAILLIGLLPATALAVGPTAVDDHVSVPVNASATTIDVLANDVGPGNNVQSATDPAHGTVAVAADKQSLTYQPDLGFHGTDTFDYTIKHGAATDDGVGDRRRQQPAGRQWTIPEPCARRGSYGGAFPVTEDFVNPVPPPPDLLRLVRARAHSSHNDSDPDGDPLTWEIVSQPAHGDILKIDEESFEYRPNADYSATDHGLPATDFDTFTYRAFDGYAYSAPATMQIWVAPVNDAPTFDPGPPQVVVGEDSGAHSAAWATAVSPGPPSESWQTVHFETRHGPQRGAEPVLGAARGRR